MIGRYKMSSKKLKVNLFFLLISSYSFSSDWLLYNEKADDCLPEHKFTPDQILADIPECTAINKKEYPGILLIDCMKTKYNFGLIFVSSKENCELMKKYSD